MNLKVFFCEETLWLFTSYSGFKFQPWKKKLEKKKKCHGFSKEIKLFLLAVTPQFFTPQKEFFDNPVQKKLAEKKKCHGSDQKFTLPTLTANFF